jgi:hypothetical protein
VAFNLGCFAGERLPGRAVARLEPEDSAVEPAKLRAKVWSPRVSSSIEKPTIELNQTTSERQHTHVMSNENKFPSAIVEIRKTKRSKTRSLLTTWSRDAITENGLTTSQPHGITR